MVCVARLMGLSLAHKTFCCVLQTMSGLKEAALEFQVGLFFLLPVHMLLRGSQ